MRLALKIEKILIIFPGSLGDFIAFIPALEAVRSKFPSSYIELICNSDFDVLIRFTSAKPDKISSISTAPISGLFVNPPGYTDKTQYFFSEFDLIISYLDDEEAIFSNNLKKISSGKIISVKSNIRKSITANIYMHYLLPLEQLGIESVSTVPRLLLPKEKIREGKSFLKKLGYREKEKTACIHPGSGSAVKNWNIKKFLKLADEMETRFGINPLFLIGPADEKLKEKIDGEYPVLHNPGLETLASVMANSHIYIGNDSGISHLAASAGVQCFLIFGPTKPEIWAPQCKNAVIIRNEEAECYGCVPGKIVDCNTRYCLDGIDSSYILEKINKRLRLRGKGSLRATCLRACL